MYIYTLNSDSSMGKFDVFVMSAILDNVEDKRDKIDDSDHETCTLDELANI